VKRRTFIAGLGGTVAWPVVARAQRSALPVIGFISGGWPDALRNAVDAFHQGLRESGYVEGHNVTIDYRWAGSENDKLPAMAADLVGRDVAVIAAMTTPAVLAAKAATSTIPIVFFTAGDPVELGLVASLNRPGGHLTGSTTLTLEVGPKRLELLHEMVPMATVLALLVNPTSPNLAEAQSRDLQTAARTIGLEIHMLYASKDADFEPVFENLAKLRAGGLAVSSDSFFYGRAQQLAALAAHHTMPAIYAFREHVAVGGLMSYGAHLAESFRWVGVYTGRVLKGARPASLPVLQSSKYELVINLKTAKALGLTVPPSLLARADEVIE
jgi:putative tryptophan/tyrosine transport system substrate-binding protein